MRSTDHILRKMATFHALHGLHTGDQFAVSAPRWQLDICASAWLMAEESEDGAVPAVFFANEVASRELVEGSAGAMAALTAISDAIRDYPVPDTDGKPDVIEHVFNWTATAAAIGRRTPPTLDEVIGCILRAADNTAASPRSDAA